MESVGKRQKTKHQEPLGQIEETKSQTVIIQFRDSEQKDVGFEISVGTDTSKVDLNNLLEEVREKKEGEDPQRFQFYLDDKEIKASIQEVLDRIQNSRLLDQQDKKKLYTGETVIPVTFKPEAMFRIRPITRASSTLEGHNGAVLDLTFSPDGKYLASGAGDSTMRLWDLTTELPLHTCEGHKDHVLFVAFSPDSKVVASGGMDKVIYLWDSETGEQIGKPLRGHTKFVTSIAWQPMISQENDERLMASSSKDMQTRIWDTKSQTCLKIFSQHTGSVTKVLWGGEGLIYTASQDRTIKCWDAKVGNLVNDLKGHAHWVNTLALSTDYVLQTGCFDHTGKHFQFQGDQAKMKQYALERYNKARDAKGEVLVSGSDDNTMMMWQPRQGNKPMQRLTGHQGLIIQVAFSPDGYYLASASFDKSIKLWDGKTGKFITSFRGHVASVYQMSWSADSRMLVSGSKDSTLKVWDVEKRKMMFDLPGHSDEVYCLKWSPDGLRVASGSKDKMMRIWRN